MAVAHQHADSHLGWQVWNGVPYLAHIVELSPSEGTLSVTQDLALPRDAIVDEARFGIAASARGLTSIGSVADVRRTSDESGQVAIIDFGRLVTISTLEVADLASSLSTWNGTAFEPVDSTPPNRLGEVATERVKLHLSASVSAGEIESRGVVLPATPTGLELDIGGTTVWFERQGSDPGATDSLEGDVVYDVDRTDALREALRRAAGQGAGQRPDGGAGEGADAVTVRVELRAATPGQLSLKITPRIRRVHAVVFPDGPARTLEPATEGPVSLSLPLPQPASSSWAVDAVELVARGTVPPTRTVPATGPEPAGDAHLVLTPGRALLGQVPDMLLGRLETLTGIRLLLAGGSTGGEVGGVLLAGLDGTPGEPVPGGELHPAVVPVGEAPAWVTLELTEPITPPAELWLEIQAASGAVEWTLTGSPVTDPAAPGAPLRRRLPGGGIRPLSQVVGLPERLGVVRLVGTPDPNQPIEALSIAAGDDAEAAAFTPTGDGVDVLLGRSEAVSPEDGVLPLVGHATAPAAYTFEQIRVIYEEVAP